MKLQHKLYLGLVAIFTILLMIGGLIFSQEYQKRAFTERLVSLYRPAVSATEGMKAAFSELSSAVIRGVSPAIGAPQGSILASIELFNEHLNELSHLSQQAPLSHLQVNQLGLAFEEASVLGLSLVNQYREMLRQQELLEQNVDRLLVLLEAIELEQQPELELLLLQKDLLRLNLYISSPLQRDVLYNKRALKHLERQLARRIEGIRHNDLLSFLLSDSELGYGVGEVRTLYLHIMIIFDRFHLKRSQYEVAQQDLKSLLTDMSEQVAKTNNNAVQQLQAISRNGRDITFILIPLGIIISGLLAYQTASRIREPLAQLLEAIRFAQAGDFSYRIDIKSNDEVAKLASHFNEMMDRLGSITVSRSYLQQVLDTVLHGVIVIDDDFDIRFINATASSYFPAKARVGVSLFDCRTDEGAILLNERERRRLQGHKELKRLEKNIRLVSGERIVLTLAVTELVINEVVHWVISLHDITQMKKAEKNLQLYARVFETSNDAIVISSKHNVIEQVNPAFTRITGFSAEEVVGNNPSVLSSGRQDGDFYRSMWSELLMQGSWQGEIWNRRKNGEAYAEWLSIVAIHNEFGLIERFVGVFSDITQRKEAEQMIHHQANYDALTELPNRRLFWDRLAQSILRAEESSTSVALMYLDLDGFKPVNDTFGHEYGDLLLKQVASLMTDLVKASDTVARLGGDEFAIILPHCEQRLLEQTAGELVKRLMQPIKVKDKLIYIGASVGISLYPELADNQEQLVHQADSAMYHVKNDSKSSFVFYDRQMEAVAYERRQLEQDLREAVDKEQMTVIFQPLYDTRNDQIVSVEALLRWEHPIRGQIMPSVFIPLAEDTDIIYSLSEWALKEICQQAVTYLSLVGYVRVAVNISPKQFSQPDFVDKVTQVLDDTGFPAQYLELEVTERLIINDLSTTSIILSQLSDLGVSIVVDDFGIGYASLNDLSRYQVKELKFDRSFIKDVNRSPKDTGMIRSMADMAHQMGMKVVAEGVEDESSLALLKEMGCDFIQGFVYNEAMTMGRLVKLLEEQKINAANSVEGIRFTEKN